MLAILNIAQLVLYIALLALLGQGALYLLAGAQRERNLFYQLLRIVGQPFTGLVRRLTPARLSDRAVPVLTFWLLLAVYALVTFEKIGLCLSLNMVGCR